MKTVIVAAVMFLSIDCLADVVGTYGVSGKLLQPEYKQCFTSIVVATKDSTISISGFSCGTAQFPGVSALIQGDPNADIGATLKDLSGNVVGGLTKDTITYSAKGNTVRLSVTSATKGGLNFSGNGFLFRGDLTKTN